MGGVKRFCFSNMKKHNKLRLSNSALSRSLSLFLYFCLMLRWLYNSVQHFFFFWNFDLIYLLFIIRQSIINEMLQWNFAHTQYVCLCMCACMRLLHMLAHTLTHRCNDTQIAERSQWRKLGILKLRTVSLGATQTW